MKLSEQLRMGHESGDFGKALAGYSERAEALEKEIAQYKETECFTPPVTCSDNCSLVKARKNALTEREKWLMKKAYEAGFIGNQLRVRNGVDDWLQQSAADAVTVEMVLVKQAPNF